MTPFTLNSNSTTGALNSYKRMVPLLGTFIRIELRSPNHTPEFLAEQVDLMLNEIKRVQMQMSYYEASSDVSRLNRAGLGEWTTITPATAQVLAFAEEMRHHSQGLFNVGFGEAWSGAVYELNLSDEKIPQVRKIQKGEIDLGGIAKGYAADQAFRIIAVPVEAREIFGSIDAGGDLFVFEANPVPVAIQVAVGESVDHRILSFQKGAVATSSTRPSAEIRLSYRKNGDPIYSIPKTATVIADSAMVADALTKVVLLSETAEELQVAKQCLARFKAQGLTQGLHEVHENV